MGTPSGSMGEMYQGSRRREGRLEPAPVAVASIRRPARGAPAVVFSGGAARFHGRQPTPEDSARTAPPRREGRDKSRPSGGASSCAPLYMETRESGPHGGSEQPLGELRGAVVVLVPVARHPPVTWLDGEPQAHAVHTRETLPGPIEGVLEIEL